MRRVGSITRSIATKTLINMTTYTHPVINADDIVIPVMGITGSGKSTFISLCTEEKVDIGHGLMSCQYTSSRKSTVADPVRHWRMLDV
jgi:ABC-type lipoprotein export system ATPase subunit